MPVTRPLALCCLVMPSLLAGALAPAHAQDFIKPPSQACDQAREGAFCGELQLPGARRAFGIDRDEERRRFGLGRIGTVVAPTQPENGAEPQNGEAGGDPDNPPAPR